MNCPFKADPMVEICDRWQMLKGSLDLIREVNNMVLAGDMTLKVMTSSASIYYFNQLLYFCLAHTQKHTEPLRSDVHFHTALRYCPLWSQSSKNKNKRPNHVPNMCNMRSVQLNWCTLVFQGSRPRKSIRWLR